MVLFQKKSKEFSMIFTKKLIFGTIFELQGFLGFFFVGLIIFVTHSMAIAWSFSSEVALA